MHHRVDWFPFNSTMETTSGSDKDDLAFVGQNGILGPELLAVQEPERIAAVGTVVFPGLVATHENG
jgi:hypothetical protein